MFCEHCRRLLDFSQNPTRYNPQRKPLGGNTKGLLDQQQKRENPTTPAVKIFKDTPRYHLQPVWWKIPVSQTALKNLLAPSFDFECQICAMIFSNVSTSIVKGLLNTAQAHQDALSFVYKLVTPLSPSDVMPYEFRGGTLAWKRRHLMHVAEKQDIFLSVWLEINFQLLPMIQFKINAVAGTPKPKSIGKQGATNTGSSSTFALAASWLRNCIGHHPGCSYQRGKDFRHPTRLVDVGTVNGIQKPHLWVPGENTLLVPYMTLSHRWGTSPRVILTKTSIHTLSEEIEVSELPRSHQDAISITRFLGIRYLWIDSLCIIQDSVADWQAESAMMGNIYKFSLCTIAASWALSDDEGCFINHAPLQAHFDVFQGIRNVSESELSAYPRDDLKRQSRKDYLDTIQGIQCGTSSKDNSREQASQPLNNTCRPVGDPHTSPSKMKTYKSLPENSAISHQLRSRLPSDMGFNPNGISKRMQMQRRTPDRKTRSAVDRFVLEVPHSSQLLAQMKAMEKFHGQYHKSRLRGTVLSIKPFQKDLWTHSVDLCPLNRRAWVLQERLLSPRILHYSRTQLFWECKTAKACETSPEPVSRMRPGAAGTVHHLESSHELYGIDADPLHEHWLDIVETYSDTNMTKTEDKLVAISGLAKEVRKNTKDMYCAGVWRKDLINQLLWRVQTPQEYKAIAYRAPSWSWASVDGRVTFIARTAIETYPEISVSNVRTLGIDSTPWSFGQISYGSMRVRGTLKTAQRCESLYGEYKLLLADQLEELENDMQVTYGDYYPDMIPNHSPENPFCLPIMSFVNGRFAIEKENRGRGLLAGLVITPTGDFRDEYRRIGIFSISNPAGKAWFEGRGQQDLCDITLV